MLRFVCFLLLAFSEFVAVVQSSAATRKSVAKQGPFRLPDETVVYPYGQVQENPPQSVDGAPQTIPPIAVDTGFIPPIDPEPGYVPQYGTNPGFIPPLGPDPGYLPPYGPDPGLMPQYGPSDVGYFTAYGPDTGIVLPTYGPDPGYPVDPNDPHVPYVDPYNFPDEQYQQGPTPTKAPKSSGFSTTLLLLFALMGMSSTTETTTTTTLPTTTEFPGDCEWGAWSACTLPCKGTRTRTRKCQGNTMADMHDCNTQLGWRSDGDWYRAPNCYDYLWSLTTVLTKEDAEEACNVMNGRLASTGLRNNDVRAEVVNMFATIKGLDNIEDAFVGISNEADETIYVWSDGHEGNPQFWLNTEPNDGATACIILTKGLSYGLKDELVCTNTPYSYLCERPAS